jgi:micrococcal nuclease
MARLRRARMLKSPRRPGQLALLAAVVALLAITRFFWPELFQPAAPPPLEPGLHRVARVVDGDTLLLAEGKTYVRLIGADTPETVKPNWPVEPWGPEAAEFTRRFVAGSEVRLEFDGPPRDKYGRVLAHVWVGDKLLEEELIRAGLARAELNFRYSAAMKDRFRRAEAEARQARRGIWSDKL